MTRRKRPVRTGDSRRYYDWLDRAGDDIVCAGFLLKDDNCYNGSAFHCQQAIEKALKAYILLKCGELVDGHNLTWLCKRAMRYDNSFAEWLEESASLNKCYIETRYPADLLLDLDYRQVSRFYKMASDMYVFICKELDEILDKEREDPDSPSKE